MCQNSYLCYTRDGSWFRGACEVWVDDSSHMIDDAAPLTMQTVKTGECFNEHPEKYSKWAEIV